MSPRSYKLLLLFLLVNLFWPFTKGQEYLFDADILTSEDGLANLMVTSIYKDKQGFIWAGTAYGLNQYNGYEFKLFTKEGNALHANTNIARIREDEKGRLWLFYRAMGRIVPEPYTINAIDIFDPVTRKAVPFDNLYSDNAPFKAHEICFPKILDPENNLWIHTNKGELFLLDNGHFKKIFELEGVFFQYITIDKKGDIWLGWQNNLISIDTSGRVLEKMELSGQILGIWAGDDGMMWTATQNTKSQKIDLWRKTQNSSLAFFELSRNGQAVEIQSQTASLHLNQSGYWFVELEGKIHLFDSQGVCLYKYTPPVGQKLDIKFRDYLEDGDRLWLASSTGVFKISARANPFQLIHKKEKKFSDCRSITEDEKGNIYFLNSHIYQWNTNTQQCRELSSTKGSALSLFYEDSLLWAGTYGISPMGFQLDLRTNKKTDYIPFNINKFLVYSIVKTSNPNRFLAGLNRGLAYLDFKEQKLLPYEGYDLNNTRDSMLEQSEVYFIHKNTSGYWLATDNGIFLLEEDSGVIGHYSQSTGYLPFDHIRHIHEGEDGVFWLATKGGGVILWRPFLPRGGEQTKNIGSSKTKGSYRQFTKEDGLVDNFTYAIYEDAYGKLWIPSDKGLMQMDKNSFRIRVFTTDNGLLHDEFNQNAHYQAKDSTLYFGGLGGLIAFHPRIFKEECNNSTPLEFIGYYVLEEGAAKMTDRTHLLQESAAITIRPNDKFFELHFTLLDYDDTEQHGYVYQIEGYSTNWNFIEENSIRITNLPYGDYTLRIQGRNRSRGWSEQELSLVIHVLKPFYLQWWFLIILGVLITGAVLATTRWRIKQLKRGKEQLEIEVQKRTWELEEKNRRIELDRQTIAAQAEGLRALDKAKTRFFSNVTHEFRTPLTLIIGPLEQVAVEQGLPTMFKRRITGVLKNARHLLILINQMLDLSKIEGGHMKTEIVHGDIITYTKGLVSQFQVLTQKKEQRLHFVTSLDVWETYFDKDKWDKIFYNLLSNAIKFTDKGLEIQVSLMKIEKSQQDYILLDVTDSGIGIEKEQLLHIFDRFYQADSASTRAWGGTGIGLALVKELVELQGGEIRVSSEVSKGTTFKVFLPIPASKQVKPLMEESYLKPAKFQQVEEAKTILIEPVSDFKEQEKLELLIIEDNNEMRDYIRSCIDTSFYHISEAANGEEGIEKAQQMVPDLIISDVMMPKRDGFEVTEAIRTHLATSHIPLILLTAKASLESRLKGLERGADAYLTKPFSPKELTLRIRKLIELRHLLRQRYQNGIPPSEKNTAFKKEDGFVFELRTYVTDNIAEPGFGVDSISKHFAISRAQLYRKLKALIDMSIGDYIKTIRLEMAMQLLREQKLNIAEIAYETGFSSPSNFSRAFKKHYGKSPSEL